MAVIVDIAANGTFCCNNTTWINHMTIHAIPKSAGMPMSLSDSETSTLPDIFEDFWTLYPRKIAKKHAREMWARITPESYPEILSALVDWRKVWKDKELEFLPHPGTWLNGERWADELPQCSTWNNASHVPASLPKQEARTAMPDKVRGALRKLRA